MILGSSSLIKSSSSDFIIIHWISSKFINFLPTFLPTYHLLSLALLRSSLLSNSFYISFLLFINIIWICNKIDRNGLPWQSRCHAGHKDIICNILMGGLKYLQIMVYCLFNLSRKVCRYHIYIVLLNFNHLYFATFE